jgi:hypothetical protein
MYLVTTIFILTIFVKTFLNKQYLRTHHYIHTGAKKSHIVRHFLKKISLRWAIKENQNETPISLLLWLLFKTYFNKVNSLKMSMYKYTYVITIGNRMGNDFSK